MNIVQMGNKYYYIYIAIAVIYFLLLLICLKKREKRVVHAELLTILFLNLALHFIKLAFEPYRSNLPSSVRRISFENICAVSTMLFPFIYLFKKQNVLHDYVFFIGLCGGLGALFYPTEAIGESAFCFDVIRFYICHINLWVVPLLAAICGLYRPRVKMFWAIPLLFMVHELIIMVNEIVLIKVDLVHSTWAEFLDRGIRNNSFVFGVLPEFDSIKGVIDIFVPNFLRQDMFGINGGVPFYTPVVWLALPAYVFFTPIYVLLTSPFWISTLAKKRKKGSGFSMSDF